MHTLEETLRKRIASGLKRHAITTCSKWAEAYRVMGQPFPGQWSFKHHPWVKAIHDCQSRTIVGQKAAQMAFTETALNLTFFKIDVEGKSVLYLLPASTPDATDFSTSRFDPALELSPHLKTLFSDVSNIGHKRAGSANLFVRGSRSRSQLKSLPVSIIIFDEYDEMNQANAKLALERMSGQLDKQAFLLSTPTVPNVGINARYRESTQNYYVFKCPSCKRYTDLDFERCLKITAESVGDPQIYESYYVCKECGSHLPQMTKPDWLSLENAQWISGCPQQMLEGFWISQLYSMTMEPWEIAANYFSAQTNPADEQEFFNSKLGMPHMVEGAKIGDEDLTSSIGDYRQYETAPRQASLITMGIDVGNLLHYEIDQWFVDRRGSDINVTAWPRVLKIGELNDFESIDQLIKSFGVTFTVIDAHPEKRKSLELARRFYSRVRVCYYVTGVTGREMKVDDEEQHTLKIDRTSWMDMALSRFRKGKRIRIPKDTPNDYRNHIKAPVRVYEKDKDGNLVGRYVTGEGDDDHYAHARTYAEVALPLAGIAQNRNMNKIF